MSLVADVIARLQAQVPTLASVEGAAELAHLIGRGVRPHRTPAAYVVPGADEPGPPEWLTGLVAQRVASGVSVVLIHNVDGDTSGALADQDLEIEKAAVLAALVGWQPASADDPLAYARGPQPQIVPGAVVRELAFRAAWWLRVPA